MTIATERVVVIPELVFRDAMMPPEAILRAHGIVPTRPYDHEAIVVHGAVAHRYTQPPRSPHWARGGGEDNDG
jgi:hypothetical protein